MGLCRLIFPVLVLSVVQSYSSSVQVPVFLWGDLTKTSFKSNPLSQVGVEEFRGILKQELQEDPFTVIFIEETLSVEDFLRNNDGSTSFPYLHANIGDALYLSAVENPLRVLNKRADPEKVGQIELTENGLSAEIEPESGKFLFISLKDAREGMSRSNLLRQHNDFMEDMFTKLQEKYNKVVAIYTARNPSWTIPETHSRVRRQAAESIKSHSFEGLLLFLNHTLLNDVPLSDVRSAVSVFRNNTEMNTTLAYDTANVTLIFVTKAGYWFLGSVILEQDSVVEELEGFEGGIFSLVGFSYRCGQNVTFGTVNETRQYTLTFQDMQVQPFFINNNTGLVYGDSFNCVGFFTAPIWAGLFVVFILLAITMYGVMMMMDIRTMDRFDDPKGKTITINAAE